MLPNVFKTKFENQGTVYISLKVKPYHNFRNKKYTKINKFSKKIKRGGGRGVAGGTSIRDLRVVWSSMQKLGPTYWEKDSPLEVKRRVNLI